MKQRPEPFVYHWSILGDQPDIENAFGIQNNTPTTLALSPFSMVKVT
jgi:hypothetical protein